jgi:hypothetical protein
MIRAKIHEFIYWPVSIQIRSDYYFAWIHGDKMKLSPGKTSVDIYRHGEYVGCVPVRWLTAN